MCLVSNTPSFVFGMMTWGYDAAVKVRSKIRARAKRVWTMRTRKLRFLASRVGAVSYRDSSPSQSRNDPLPQGKIVAVVGAVSYRDYSPSQSRNDPLPQGKIVAVVGAVSYRDSSPSQSRNDPLPQGKIVAVVGAVSYRDSLPSQSRNDPLPQGKIVDVVGAVSYRDSSPSQSRNDPLPQRLRRLPSLILGWPSDRCETRAPIWSGQALHREDPTPVWR